MVPRFASARRVAHLLQLRVAAHLCWMLVALRSLSAASAQYHIDSWTTENGLPQNVVKDACQTPDGYLWLATMDGLVRFDGVRFVVFNRANTPGILGNRYTSLYCTSRGEFWAGTESSGVTRYRQGSFTTYTTEQGLPSNDVPGVTGDGSGQIWVLAHTSVVRWNEAESRFVELPSEKSKYSHFSNSDERFGFWGINGDDLRLFVRGKVLHYLLPREWPRETLTTASQDLSGNIWLASPDGRLAKLSGGHWSKIIRTSGGETRLPLPGDLASTYRDSRGNLWNIAVAPDPVTGLRRYLSLPSGGWSQRIAFNSFFEDREGSVWLPTNGQGLYRIRKQAISIFSKEDGLPDRNIYPINQDRAGAIWIGTWEGGLVRLSGGKLKTFSIADGLLSRRINSISEDRDGVLWVATPAGLQRMRNGRFELVQNETQGSGEVRAIHQDREGTLWLGTGQGLVRCRNGNWSVITAKDGLATDDVRVIINGRAGNLWIGGYGGLTSLDRGQLRRWTEANGLPSNSIRSLYEDRDGVLWIGTYDGGLGRLQKGRLTRYTVREGLFNNGVFQILEDSRGYLWMTCNRGIYRVSKSELNQFAVGQRRVISSIAYGKSDGMRNAECNGGLSPAGIRTRNGELWFPTQDGVAVIDPDRVTANLRPPPVAIESISVDGEPAESGKPLRIPPGRQNLQIDYTALSLLNSEQIKFKYKLQSLDRDWVDAGTRRTAYYSHLPPGNYVFTVIAANSDGVWNMDGKSVPVLVLPPFYRTWWFMTLASLLVAGAVVLAWQYRVTQLQHANALQQAFSRQLINSQEQERKRIASELHDSLGQHLVVIKNLVLVSLNNGKSDEAVRSHMEEISAEASRALGEVREISYNLRPYQLDRIGLTKAIEAIVKKASGASSIAFTSAIDEIDDVFPKDSEINFYRVVQECINNVLKHSRATEASVVVQRERVGLRLTVRDNGQGFTPGTANPGQSADGFGMIGITERAQLLGGKPMIHSARNEGTMISIEIPLPL
jgi:signal transduction histidine kinase/ligand-binding sensor domain-containing protein